MRDIILVLVMLPCLPFCFFRPFFGVLLWTFVAFLNPQSFVWGFAAALPLAQAVALATIAGLVVFSAGSLRNLASREALIIIVLGLWFTITTLISTTTPEFIHHAKDTWDKWGLVSKILLMVLVTIALTDSFRRLRLLVLVVAGAFGFFVLKSLPFLIATGGAFRLYGPAHSMIADNNDFGLALNMSIPIFFFLAQTESNPWMKRLFGFLFVIAIPAVFSTYSRGALVGLIAVLSLMFLLNLKRAMVLLPVLALAVIIVVAFAPPKWKERMNPNGEVVDASARSRFNSWTYCWNLALDYPIAGGGFATFTAELFDRYAPNTLDVHNSHSIYFGVLAEHGFVGLLLFLTVIAICFRATGHMIKWGRRSGNDEAVKYAQMFRFSIVGFLVSGIFLSRTYFDYFYTVVACIAVLQRLRVTEWAEQEEELELEEATV